MASLDGQTALITGAASGIGRGLAEVLAERGARVVLADIDAAGVERVALALVDQGLRARAVTLDVRDAAAFDRVAAEVFEKEGRLDLFFNNAGIGGAYGEAHELSLAEWNQVLDVNLRGVIHGIAAVYPRMVAQRSGHIANTASLAGLVPSGWILPYTTAKHAVVGLSTGLRVEGRIHGVRVSAVCPGFIDTNIFQGTIVYKRVKYEEVRALMPKPLSPAACARRILRGIKANRAIIPITAFSWTAWLLWRWLPGLVFWVARLQLAQVRALVRPKGSP